MYAAEGAEVNFNIFPSAQPSLEQVFPVDMRFSSEFGREAAPCEFDACMQPEGIVYLNSQAISKDNFGYCATPHSSPQYVNHYLDSLHYQADNLDGNIKYKSLDLGFEDLATIGFDLQPMSSTLDSCESGPVSQRDIWKEPWLNSPRLRQSEQTNFGYYEHPILECSKSWSDCDSIGYAPFSLDNDECAFIPDIDLSHLPSYGHTSYLDGLH